MGVDTLFLTVVHQQGVMDVAKRLYFVNNDQNAMNILAVWLPWLAMSTMGFLAVPTASVRRCTVYLLLPASSFSSPHRQAECNALAERANSVYWGGDRGGMGAFRCDFDADDRLYRISTSIGWVTHEFLTHAAGPHGQGSGRDSSIS